MCVCPRASRQFSQLLVAEPAQNLETPDLLPWLDSALVGGGLKSQDPIAAAATPVPTQDALLAGIPGWREAPDSPAGVLLRHLRFHAPADEDKQAGPAIEKAVSERGLVAPSPC